MTYLTNSQQAPRPPVVHAPSPRPWAFILAEDYDSAPNEDWLVSIPFC